MYHRYLKPGVFAFSVMIVSAIFSFGTLVILKSEEARAGIFLRDMTSSYSFVDDVYFLSISSLQKRLESFSDQLYDMTKQPICLSAQFSSFKEAASVNLSACSENTKISDLAKKTGNSGVVDIQLGNKKVGEIEWITQTKLNFIQLFQLFISYLTALSSVGFLAWYLFNTRNQPEITESNEENASDSELKRSLYRVMSNNRRIMGLNDNWVCCESATHPNVMIYTLEGSKVRLRASLKDINKIFPHACFINRSTLINPNTRAHSVQGNKLMLESKNFKREYDIDPTYLDDLDL